MVTKHLDPVMINALAANLKLVVPENEVCVICIHCRAYSILSKSGECGNKAACY